MKRWYFAYGMNTNIREMARRCPGAVCHGPVVLRDHKFVFRLHADVEHSPGRHVEGVLWELTPACEQALDMLEGYPHYYNKKEVIVESTQARLDGLTRFAAMVYYMNRQEGTEHPGSMYLSCLNEGYTDNGLNHYQLKQALVECEHNEKTS
jgi:gamma-glutamylcyclotransferase (GGCT)/AIG2-like uncharacterized protein YtfP